MTESEIIRNKVISKKQYIVMQYFGMTTLFVDRCRARFTTIIKESIDAMFRQFAFNLRKGAGLLKRLPAQVWVQVRLEPEIQAKRPPKEATRGRLGHPD